MLHNSCNPSTIFNGPLHIDDMHNTMGYWFASHRASRARPHTKIAVNLSPPTRLRGCRLSVANMNDTSTYRINLFTYMLKKKLNSLINLHNEKIYNDTLGKC
jgi:hypothetical protein